MKRNWKRFQPTGCREAVKGCKDFAAERGLSVERLADAIGQVDHWVIYKWIESGRIPAIMIRPFQLACGCDFITRWLVASEGKFLVSIPSGQAAHPEDMQILQTLVNDSIGALLAFYAGKAEAEPTLDSLRTAITELAWHRENVAKSGDPELDFGGEE
jgi:hypothetical protein